MKLPRRPFLYEINTRIWLSELSRIHGVAITLANVPEPELARLEHMGVDLLWLMGVWRTGAQSAAIAREHPGLAAEFRVTLPNCTRDDVAGSPFAVAEYTVEPALGGTRGLAAFRGRLAKRGIGLILDFVPNHVGLDHQWVTKRPEYFVQGARDDLARDGGTFFEVETPRGPRVLAHGKDPYFPAWTDTVQFNFQSPATRSALENVLKTISEQCDGVRCDMAMLPLEEIFARVWGAQVEAVSGGSPRAAGEFWTGALRAARQQHPGFLFLAEAYWGLEGKLQSLGFDYTYDKSLYDVLRAGDAQAVRACLEQDLSYQRRCVRFLENHDEPRAAAAFPWERHRAAALVASTVPGMLLYHEGQLEGRRVRTPVQLIRRAEEPIAEPVSSFYERLLELAHDPVFQAGDFRLLSTRPAWDGNPTWLGFLTYEWRLRPAERMLIAVNYGATRGQCYVEIEVDDPGGASVELVDLLGSARYVRDAAELGTKGLYLDMPSYGAHLFKVETRAEEA